MLHSEAEGFVLLICKVAAYQLFFHLHCHVVFVVLHASNEHCYKACCLGVDSCVMFTEAF